MNQISPSTTRSGNFPMTNLFLYRLWESRFVRAVVECMIHGAPLEAIAPKIGSELVVPGLFSIFDGVNQLHHSQSCSGNQVDKLMKGERTDD